MKVNGASRSNASREGFGKNMKVNGPGRSNLGRGGNSWRSAKSAFLR